VRVVTLARDQVLRVPVSAVFPLPAGSGTNGDRQSPGMAVFAVESGRARLVPVKVGGRNGVDAWIESGLAPGATVIVYPPSAVKDGGRVRSRKV
jgi:HlyD family secretion protein